MDGMVRLVDGWMEGRKDAQEETMIKQIKDLAVNTKSEH